MSSVQYANPTNSTHFTTCCKVAILPYQENCPKCREPVTPYYKGMPQEEKDSWHRSYYDNKTDVHRHSIARSKEYGGF